MCGKGGTNKTAIMYRGNLSYEQLQRYLMLLCNHALLEKNQVNQFQTTAKGMGFLEQAEGVMNFLMQLQEERGRSCRYQRCWLGSRRVSGRQYPIGINALSTGP